MSFSHFDLHEELAQSLDSAGYENPTPLQKQLIPLINERKDILVNSQTATGKTGAFLIPLSSYLLNNPLEEHHGSRVLILTSRRERVNQIHYTLKRIVKNFDLRVGFISGGRPYQHQMRLLKRPLDVLIATPGRLDDLVKNNKTDFSNLEALIIDDFSIIYHHDLHTLCKTILEQANANGHNCPTVAFYQKDDESEQYIKDLLPNAELIDVPEEKHPLVSIPQNVYIADDHTHKVAIIDQMMDELEDQSILVYTASNKAAKEMEEILANHGHTAQLAHQVHVDSKITSQEYPVIIVSDQVDPGIATTTYKNIIHFDLPKNISIFQNRISNKGWEELEKPAAILVAPQDRVILKKIEAQAGTSLEQASLPGLEPLNGYVSTPLLSLNPKKGKGKTKGRGNKATSGRGVNYRNKRKAKNGRSGTGNGSKNNGQRQKQHKGPYGRLNGGIHRKRSRKPGHNHSLPGNSVANPAINQNNADYNGPVDSFAKELQELKERKPKQNKVVIQYKDRRSRHASLAAKNTHKDNGDTPGE